MGTEAFRYVPCSEHRNCYRAMERVGTRSIGWVTKAPVAGYLPWNYWVASREHPVVYPARGSRVAQTRRSAVEYLEHG